MSTSDNKNHPYCYTYDSGNEMSSAEIDLRNVVTRRLTPRMEYITYDLHGILSSSKYRFNLGSVDMTKKCNNCTILIYDAVKKLSEKSSMGYHIYCAYSMSDGKFVG